jgi:excisionase family DNA binding protein
VLKRNSTKVGKGTIDRSVDRWLSVEQIADYLGVKPDTVYKWLATMTIPGHKVGRLWRFKISEIDEWVRSGGAAEVATE